MKTLSDRGLRGPVQNPSDPYRLVIYILAGVTILAIVLFAAFSMESAEQKRDRQSIELIRQEVQRLRAVGDWREADSIESIRQEFLKNYLKRYGKLP